MSPEHIGQQFRRNDMVEIHTPDAEPHRLLLVQDADDHGGYVRLTGRRVTDRSLGAPEQSHYVSAKHVRHVGLWNHVGNKAS